MSNIAFVGTEGNNNFERLTEFLKQADSELPENTDIATIGYLKNYATLSGISKEDDNEDEKYKITYLCPNTNFSNYNKTVYCMTILSIIDTILIMTCVILSIFTKNGDKLHLMAIPFFTAPLFIQMNLFIEKIKPVFISNITKFIFNYNEVIGLASIIFGQMITVAIVLHKIITEIDSWVLKSLYICFLGSNITNFLLISIFKFIKNFEIKKVNRSSFFIRSAVYLAFLSSIPIALILKNYVYNKEVHMYNKSFLDNDFQNICVFAFVFCVFTYIWLLIGKTKYEFIFFLLYSSMIFLTRYLIEDDVFYLIILGVMIISTFFLKDHLCAKHNKQKKTINSQNNFFVAAHYIYLPFYILYFVILLKVNITRYDIIPFLSIIHITLKWLAKNTVLDRKEFIFVEDVYSKAKYRKGLQLWTKLSNDRPKNQVSLCRKILTAVLLVCTTMAVILTPYFVYTYTSIFQSFPTVITVSLNIELVNGINILSISSKPCNDDFLDEKPKLNSKLPSQIICLKKSPSLVSKQKKDLFTPDRFNEYLFSEKNGHNIGLLVKSKVLIYLNSENILLENNEIRYINDEDLNNLDSFLKKETSTVSIKNIVQKDIFLAEYAIEHTNKYSIPLILRRINDEIQINVEENRINLTKAKFANKTMKFFTGLSLTAIYITYIFQIPIFFMSCFKNEESTAVWIYQSDQDPILILCNRIFMAQKNKSFQKEAQLTSKLLFLMKHPSILNLYSRKKYLDSMNNNKETKTTVTLSESIDSDSNI